MTKLKFPSNQLDNINIKIRIASLRSLIDLMKKGIQHSKNEEEKRIKIQANNINDELDIHELRTDEEIYNLEYINYFDGNFKCSQIENTATYSIIPSCYMLFETNLVAFANIAKQHYFLNLKYNELVGGKTEKIKKYLRKLANINISTFNSWNSLKDLEIIRDCIIHNEGKVNDEFRGNEKLKSIIKKYPEDISISKPFHEDEYYVAIKFSLCEKFIEMVDSFFNDLIEAFGFNQNVYYGAEASKQILNERINAKKEFDDAIKKAKEIYNKRMELL